MTDPILSIRFQHPAPLLTLNARLHWAAKAPITRVWRNAAHIAAVAASRGHGPAARAIAPGIVRCTFEVSGARRRDPHNYVATVKPIVDGLVDAGLWPDDTPDWVRTVEPVLAVTPVPRRHHPLQQRWCTVEITPMEAS